MFLAHTRNDGELQQRREEMESAYEEEHDDLHKLPYEEYAVAPPPVSVLPKSSECPLAQAVSMYGPVRQTLP